MRKASMFLRLKPVWRAGLFGLLALATQVLVACASPSLPVPDAEHTLPQTAPETPERSPQALSQDAFYEGRLSVTVDAGKPQTWSAPFSLRGRPEEGRLALYSPFGSTVALVQWDAHAARLEASGQSRSYPSVEQLLEQELKVGIPLESLFDWLAGRDTPAPGWTTQGVSTQERERIFVRSQPQPEVTVKVLLDE